MRGRGVDFSHRMEVRSMSFFRLSIGSVFALLLASGAAAQMLDAAFSVKQEVAAREDSAAEREGEGEQHG